MKRFSAILLALVLILCAGCAKTSPRPQAQAPVETEAPAETTETQPPETTEPPTEPLPQTEEGTILADHVPAILAVFSRGDTLDVVGAYDESHYVVQLENGYGLVEKRLLAMANDPAYEAWTGYARWDAKVFDNFRLSGTPVKALSTNIRVEVLDDLGECLVVRVGDITGFVSAKTVSKYPIPSGGSDSDSGSGGGGGSGGGSSGGQDGGDISLGIRGGITLLSAIPQQGAVTGKAAVRADGTEVVLGYYDRDDTVQIVIEDGFCESWEGCCTVLLNDLYAHVSSSLIRSSGEEPYTPWDGYARYNARLYDSFYLQGEGTVLYSNKPIHVLCDLGSCYLVTVDDAPGYVAKDFVSQAPISSGGGGGSDSGSGGSGGGGGGGGSEWSDPVL